MVVKKLFYGALLCLFAFDNHHMSFVEGRNSQMPENVEDIENGKGYGWSSDESIILLRKFIDSFQQIEEDHDENEVEGVYHRTKRNSDRGVTNLDIRDAILQLLNVIRDGSKAVDRHDRTSKDAYAKILKALQDLGRNSLNGKSFEKKIDNISTFLLRMNSKLDQIDRMVKRGGGRGRGSGGSNGALETLAQESFDILTLIPTYIENTKEAIGVLSEETKSKFVEVEKLLVDDGGMGNSSSEQPKKSIAKALKEAEKNILGASNELKEAVKESGDTAQNLFDRVDNGYSEITKEIKGLGKVEKVLLDTADSVMDTKRKIEFGVQQIVFKIGELVKLSGGSVDEKLEGQFKDITRTILENQNEALGNLTSKVEKEIGQVWRQMGIMYSKVSNSIEILEKVKSQTENYVNNTGKNLGTMEGQVEGLTDRVADVDSSLNYMVGQLSLVVQEFNQVKSNLADGINQLGDELEDIKEYKPSDSSSQPNGQGDI